MSFISRRLITKSQYDKFHDLWLNWLGFYCLYHISAEKEIDIRIKNENWFIDLSKRVDKLCEEEKITKSDMFNELIKLEKQNKTRHPEVFDDNYQD